MLTSSLVAAALAVGHIFGPGGLVGPQQPEYRVGRDGTGERRKVHGDFPWEYGIGLEDWLGEKERAQLVELREKHLALSVTAVVCGVVGSALTMVGLYTTPAFVNAAQPDPGGLAMPIVFASIGAVLGLVSIPVLVLSPGDFEIETLVMSHNNSSTDQDRLVVSEELVKRVVR